MSVSTALVSLFIPFMKLHISRSRMGRTSRFTYLPFGYNHLFTITCNYHDVFSSRQKIRPRISGSMTTIGTYVVVFPSSCTLSSFKKFSLWLVSSQNMDIKSVPYPFTFGMVTFLHLNLWDWSVIHTTSFSYSLFPIAPKILLSYLSFLRQNLQRNALSWGWCIQSDRLRLE